MPPVRSINIQTRRALPGSSGTFRSISILSVLTCGILSAISPQASKAASNAFEYNQLLGRGINIGNALDAPQEGAWGVTLKSEYFQSIKEAGFNSVRIPIQWSAHATLDPPYAIDPVFFKRVDWAIDQALSRHMLAVIDIHHFAEMDLDPTTYTPELLALWRQIATRYKDRPPTLLFELFNEPQNSLTDRRWNAILPQLIQTIRESNPTRTLIVGPGYWNSLDHLSTLQLPQDDRQLIVTFHYYQPFHFTHQAQAWAPETMAWKGTTWGTAQDQTALHDDFAKAATWANDQNRPIYVGEFGVSEQADPKSRILWTQAVVREAHRFHFSWSYWQFCSFFGIFDTNTDAWNQPMLHALLDGPKANNSTDR
jgi:endoglucanase